MYDCSCSFYFIFLPTPPSLLILWEALIICQVGRKNKKWWREKKQTSFLMLLCFKACFSWLRLLFPRLQLRRKHTLILIFLAVNAEAEGQRFREVPTFVNMSPLQRLRFRHLLCSVRYLSAGHVAEASRPATQTPQWEHVNHNAYHSDLNSVTTDNFTNSWGSIKAHLKYATCHFYIRKHAVQNGTFSLVFVIILQAKLVSSWGLKCQMIYSSSPLPPPLCRAVVKGWREGVRFTLSCL